MRRLGVALAVALAVTACAPPQSRAGRPERVVSLAPSLTEVIFALGASERLVGACEQCDHPPAARLVPRVGGYLAPSVELVLAARPDLVAVVPSPGNREAVRAIERAGVRVLVLNDRTLADLRAGIRALAAALGTADGGERLLAAVDAGLDAVRARVADAPRRRVLLVVGHRPLIVAGRATLQDELLTIAGGVNVAADAGAAWPAFSSEMLVARTPDVILDAAMGSEEGGAAVFRGLTTARIVPLDPDTLFRAGPRVTEAAAMLSQAIHPELGALSVRATHLTARRLVAALVALALMLVVVLAAATLIGPAPASLAVALAPGGETTPDYAILFRARLPRVLLAAVVGGSLAAAGAALQALLLNPIAEPHLLGISAGAAVAGVIAIIVGADAASPIVPLAAFLGALGMITLVYLGARAAGRASPHAILLVGVVCNALAAAAIMLANAIVSYTQAQGILFWIMGSLSSQGYGLVGVAAVYALVGVVWIIRHAQDLNLLALGEESALELGVEVERTRRSVFVAASLLVGAAVAVSGMIGFVGLIVPHLLRLGFGSDHRLLVPASFLGGATFLVAADTVARTALAPAELPVGVVTALLGGPFFIWLLRRSLVRALA